MRNKLDRMIKYRAVGKACLGCANMVEGQHRLRCLVGPPTVAEPSSCPSFAHCSEAQRLDRQP